jgi:hypothetical protein
MQRVCVVNGVEDIETGVTKCNSRELSSKSWEWGVGGRWQQANATDRYAQCND